MLTRRRRLPTGIAYLQVVVRGTTVRLISPLTVGPRAWAAKQIGAEMLRRGDALVIVTDEELDQALRRSA